MTDAQFEKIKKGLNFHSEGGIYNLCTLTETTLRTIIEDAVKFYEEQQKIDALHIMELQKQNGELTDKVRDLEEKLANADYQLEGRDLEIKELKAQIEKMKCCGNCIHCKYDENEESYEYCEKHQQVVNIAIVPCSEWKGR